MGLPRANRLRTAREFAHVQSRGRSWAHPLLILKAAPSAGSPTRFGLVCGRRVGNAVVRNRVKRRLREIARRADLPAGWDLVLIARPAAARASSADLSRAVADLGRRARLTAQRSGAS